MTKNTNDIKLLLPIVFCLISNLTFSQSFTPGVPAFDSTGYVEYIPGNLPVVISVPHGGYEEPDFIPDRDCENFTCVRDSYTQELGRSIGESFYEQTGCYPHIIINLLHRKKFDANREIIEAADGNPIVEQAWYGYHAFIDSAKVQITQDYERGLFLDLHGHGHDIQRIELGYRIWKSELQLSDNELDDDFYIQKNSIKTLVGDNLQSLTHSALLRGENSFGTLLENKGIPTVPSMQDPAPLPEDSYFTGGYNTREHGSLNGGSIDGIQIECHQSIRFDADIREVFADSLAKTINEYIDLHYNSQYDEHYCNIISNLSENSADENINIFPNPTNRYLNIEGNSDQTTISIYNLLGQKISTYIWSETPLDIGFLKNGYYILVLKKGDVWMSSTTLIKQ